MTEPLSAGRRVARHFGMLALSRGTATAFALVQGIVVARFIGTGGYGQMAAAVAYAMVVAALLDCHVWELLTRYLAKFRADQQTGTARALLTVCWSVELATGIVAAAVVLGSSTWAAEAILKNADDAVLIRIAALLVLLQIPQQTSAALLRIDDRFRVLSLHGAIAAALQLALSAAACWWWPTVTGMLVAMVAASAVNNLSLLVLGLQSQRRLATGRRDWQTLRGHRGELLRFLGVTNLSAMRRIVDRLDCVVLGWFGTTHEIGIYALAKQAVSHLISLTAPLRQALFPELSKLAAARDFGPFHRLPGQVMRLSLGLIVPACLAVVVAAPTMVPWVWGSEFSASAFYVQLLVWQMLGVSLLWVRPYLLTANRARMLLWIQLTSMAVFLAMLLTLTPAYGATGAAFAVVARFPVRAALVGFGWQFAGAR